MMFNAAAKLGAFCLLSNALTALAATEGSLKVLVYNVAGLPGVISSSDPGENTPYISARLKPYGLVHVQEDFNYHAKLYASDGHKHRTPTSGGILLGDGLNTLSDYPFIDLERVKWDDCYRNSGDCLTPKGFTAMRIQLDTGVWVDAYNLHTDAGGQGQDIKARAGNVGQLVNFIKTHSIGMPVIVMGDTNMRYSSKGEALRNLLKEVGLTDAWVKIPRNGNPPSEGTATLTCPFPFPNTVKDQKTMLACETVDKIFYRSTGTLDLTPTSFGNENLNFLNPKNGKPLSDHYPLSTTFTWKAGNTFRLSESTGGPHGNFFNDFPALQDALARSKKLPSISTLTLRAGDRLDSISVGYGSTTGPNTHGGKGGVEKVFTLDAAKNEVINEVHACQGSKNGRTRIFYLKVTTNTKRTFEAGRATKECTTMKPPAEGFSALGFWGRAGDGVDRLGVVWAKA